jgi:predicted O-methyltransferase YrrM
MSKETWAAVDQYCCGLIVEEDAALKAAITESAAAGLPTINVAPNQGKMLHLFAKLTNAKRILEIGTLGGYSTIWLARGMSAGGRLISLEADEKHARVARENIARAGLADVVEVRLGKALETLQNIPGYFQWSLKLSRPGTLILVDNVVRQGKVADMSHDGGDVVGVRRMHELIAAEPRVSATTIQTVGAKGYDGFTMILVNA